MTLPPAFGVRVGRRTEAARFKVALIYHWRLLLRLTPRGAGPLRVVLRDGLGGEVDALDFRVLAPDELLDARDRRPDLRGGELAPEPDLEREHHLLGAEEKGEQAVDALDGSVRLDRGAQAPQSLAPVALADQQP